MDLESGSPGFIHILVPTFPSYVSLGNLAVLGCFAISKNGNNTCLLGYIRVRQNVREHLA